MEYLTLKEFLEKYNLENYSIDNWYNIAFADVNKWVRRCGCKNRKTSRLWNKILTTWDVINKSDLKNDIIDLIKKIVEGVTIEAIIKLIFELAEKFDIPVGVIQKILSLLLKYSFCYWDVFKNNAQKIQDLSKIFRWVITPDMRDQLLCPIDSRVFKSLNKMRKWSDAYTSWIKMDIKTYKKVINIIFGLSGEQGISPMELEMKELWSANK